MSFPLSRVLSISPAFENVPAIPYFSGKERSIEDLLSHTTYPAASEVCTV